MERDVFSKKEAGDYLNEHFIFYKVELDKDDKDNLADKFKVEVYPSFIIIDAQSGAEHTRFTSTVGNTPDKFIAYIKNNLSHETSVAYHEAKYQNDYSYGEDYIKFLLERRMNARAREVMEDFFTKEPFDKKITETKLDEYDKLISNIDSPIIDYLVENKTQVIERVGVIPYNDFFISRSTKVLSPVMNARDVSLDDLSKALEQFKTRPHLESNYSRYVAENFSNIKNNEVMTLIKNTQKAVVGVTTYERSFIISVILRFVATPENLENEKYKAELIKLYQICYDNETTPVNRDRYYNRMQKLKN